MISDKAEGFPSNQELQKINQVLAEMIPKLEKQSQELHGHLVLMVEWWKDYEEGHQVNLQYTVFVHEVNRIDVCVCVCVVFIFQFHTMPPIYMYIYMCVCIFTLFLFPFSLYISLSVIG